MSSCKQCNAYLANPQPNGSWICYPCSREKKRLKYADGRGGRDAAGKKPRPKPLSVGEVFGRWTIIGVAPRRPNKYMRPGKNDGKLLEHRFICRCSCDEGTVKDLSQYTLRKGVTNSCGCIGRELMPAVQIARHLAMGHDGQSKNPLWDRWRNMLGRCHDPKDHAYDNYGMRGISVCDEWRNDFWAYAEYVAGLGDPGDGTSLDRINNDGDYEPGNVRWATPKQQSRNRRINRRLTFRGENRLLVEWAEITGIQKGTIDQRLRLGWSIERTLTEPTRKRTGRWMRIKRAVFALISEKPKNA